MDHKIDDFASILNPRHALRLAHKTILDANVNVWVEAPQLPLGWNDFFIISSYAVVCLVVPEKARIFGH